LEIKFLFVDWPWTAEPKGLQSTLQLEERADVTAVVKIKGKHVALVQVPVHVRLLAPVVISNLFPDLSGFSANRHIPITAVSKWNVFNWIPKIPPETSIS
jgi:hypothetical protein